VVDFGIEAIHSPAPDMRGFIIVTSPNTTPLNMAI
jgi:hypothetical protein